MPEDQPGVIRRDDARDGPRIDTISRMSESCIAPTNLGNPSPPVRPFVHKQGNPAAQAAQPQKGGDPSLWRKRHRS